MIVKPSRFRWSSIIRTSDNLTIEQLFHMKYSHMKELVDAAKPNSWWVVNETLFITHKRSVSREDSPYFNGMRVTSLSINTSTSWIEFINNPEMGMILKTVEKYGEVNLTTDGGFVNASFSNGLTIKFTSGSSALVMTTHGTYWKSVPVKSDGIFAIDEITKLAMEMNNADMKHAKKYINRHGSA